MQNNGNEIANTKSRLSTVKGLTQNGLVNFRRGMKNKLYSVKRLTQNGLETFKKKREKFNEGWENFKKGVDKFGDRCVIPVNVLTLLGVVAFRHELSILPAVDKAIAVVGIATISAIPSVVVVGGFTVGEKIYKEIKKRKTGRYQRTTS